MSSNNHAPKPRASETEETFMQLHHVDVGELSVAYSDTGPQDGTPVLLLHGWPYDIRSFDAAAHQLTSAGHRVLVPYLRGHGGTVFRDPAAPRNAQQAALGYDAIDFLDALGVDAAVLGGFDWGARAANVAAALHPERAIGLVSVSGYLLSGRAAGLAPLPPESELRWWYQYYFSTERGCAGYSRYRREFAQLIWRLASPQWRFDQGTFDASATALDNPDHVDIVIHNYRWRLGLAEGDPRYDVAEAELAKAPPISVPTITLEGDANAAPHPDSATYARKFTGPYQHRIVSGGVGHNLPQEAPDAFVSAIRDVLRMGAEAEKTEPSRHW